MVRARGWSGGLFEALTDVCDPRYVRLMPMLHCNERSCPTAPRLLHPSQKQSRCTQARRRLRTTAAVGLLLLVAGCACATAAASAHADAVSAINGILDSSSRSWPSSRRRLAAEEEEAAGSTTSSTESKTDGSSGGTTGGQMEVQLIDLAPKANITHSGDIDAAGGWLDPAARLCY